MAIYARPISASLIESGLVGMLAYTVKDAADSVLVPRTTTGITEAGTSAEYTGIVDAWDDTWSGTITWDIAPGADPLATEDFGAGAVHVAPDSPRLAAETVLFGRGGRLLHLVYVRAWPAGLPPVAILPTGANPLYDDPLSWAANAVNRPPITLVIADTEIVTIFQAGLHPVFIDLAEYRLISNAMGNFPETDESGGGRSQSWNALANRYYQRLADLEKLYAPYFRSARYQLQFGSVRLPIQSRPGSEFSFPEF